MQSCLPFRILSALRALLSGAPTGNGPMDRRRLLKLAAVTGVGLVAGACSTDDTSPSTTRTGATTSPTTGTGATTAPLPSDPVVSATPGPTAALTPADFDGLGTCQLASSATAGPFPTLEQLDRRDVTEGYPGHPVRLGLRVIDQDCNPVPGAEVEIWHTDASGDYSSYTDGGTGKDEAEGTTFCRGFQTADADGIVEFQTIYPGWYPGRAVHIHLRARVDGSEVLTSQIYFRDDYTAEVFTTGEYAPFGQPDRTVPQDGIAGDPANEGTLISTVPAETSAGTGTLGLINLGVSA